MKKAKKLILSMIIIFMATLLYAADTATPTIYYLLPIPIINHAEDVSFSEWVNIRNIDTKDDNDKLRTEWKQALGVDIFFVHFKAKEITRKIEEKSKFRLFNMRGRAKIKEDSVMYTFSRKF
jgi:hypothetical protein